MTMPDKNAILKHVENDIKSFQYNSISCEINSDIVNITINSRTPGIIIGSKGCNVKAIKESISNKFGLTTLNITIDVKNTDPVKQDEYDKNKTNKNITKVSNKPKKIIKKKKLTPIDIISDVKDYTEFSKNSDTISIYIDESWPCLDTDDEKLKKIGCIAGLVWLGETIDYSNKILPHIDTHLRETDNPETILTAFKNLINCSNAMPFIMPIDIVVNENPTKFYFELIEATIKILLGWLLPQNGKKCKVRIFPEHFTGFDDFTSKTDYIKGLIKQSSEHNSFRFQRFGIEVVQWQGKDFEYIPYGDLLAYIALEKEKLNSVLDSINYKDLYGYVPLSMNLFNTLNQLDRIEETRDIGCVYKVIDSLYGTRLFQHIISDLQKRLKNNEDLKFIILNSLDLKFAEKNRDLNKLRKYFRILYQFISDLKDKASTKIKVLFTQLELQKANHEGNPENIKICEDEYVTLREKAIKLGEVDLIVDCDLNLGVHYNDQFQFQKAFEIHSQNYNSEFFKYLKIEIRAKVISSIAQSHTLLGKYEDAYKYYTEAINTFNGSESDTKSAEIEQTSIYRLFNALEGKLLNFEDYFNSLFPDILEKIELFSKGQRIEDQYKHHVLLKCIYEREISELKEIYIKYKEEWAFEKFHPWEWIQFYRAELIRDKDPDKANDLFMDAISICEDCDHGLIMKLIGAVICCCYYIEFEDDKEGTLLHKIEAFLNQIKHHEEFKDIIYTLDDVAKNPTKHTSSDVLKLLPFNYR
jgi:hypothetical protein